MNMERIYLDYAATTPLDNRVAKTMRDFELEFYGNPSSTHREGQAARARIDTAREAVAKFINAKTQEVIFTSGATEANNLAIQGTVSHYIKEFQMKPHVITTMLEHQSVYNTVKELSKQGIIDATFISPSPDGLINPDEIIKSITANTVLVSVIFVSNEIGSVLPVREIGRKLDETNKRQKYQIMYHIDAVQAVKYQNCNVEKLNCSLLTMSAHKVHGPKGIGALYTKSRVKINNLLYGGSQEYGKRPGTQNTAGIIGMAKALELLGTLENRQEAGKKISVLRNKLIEGIKKIDQADLNGPEGEMRSPDNVSFTFYGVDQDALMTALDLAGIAASTGSACVSGSSEPSYVIESLGKIGSKPAATVRFTLGKSTKNSDIVYTLKALLKIIPQLRRTV
ncbi:MAG: cysteine desulfurase family protein [Candidatus Doudnabacteria bacterium]